MLYAFFLVNPRRLNFICQRLGTLCYVFIGGFLHIYPAYEDGTECSETLAYIIQTPGNYPEENLQHTEHGESLKSRMVSDVTEIAITIFVTVVAMVTLPLICGYHCYLGYLCYKYS